MPWMSRSHQGKKVPIWLLTPLFQSFQLTLFKITNAIQTSDDLIKSVLTVLFFYADDRGGDYYKKAIMNRN